MKWKKLELILNVPIVIKLFQSTDRYGKFSTWTCGSHIRSLTDNMFLKTIITEEYSPVPGRNRLRVRTLNVQTDPASHVGLNVPDDLSLVIENLLIWSTKSPDALTAAQVRLWIAGKRYVKAVSSWRYVVSFAVRPSKVGLYG